ncbi:MAG: tRNA (guanosine(46)-N7)-methyltransferase TrmB [Lachnospiraceae bacterium]
MRLRRIKGADEAIATSRFVIQNPKEKKQHWNETVFHNQNPIRIEVGMGKGQFIMEQARRNPDVNFVGIERYSSVLLRALEKMKEEPLENLFFLCFDAAELEEVFAQGEVERIYLNFSDPWPKERHAKRRLTSTRFLERYDHILASQGVVEFKTDNRELFDFSLEQLEEAGWQCQMVTYDLHHSDYLDGNIMTEYETKFVEQKKPIGKLIAYR